MRNIAANMLSILIVLGIIFLAVVGLARQQISAPGPSADTVSITVARGAKLGAVAGLLSKTGAIENETLFKLAARYSGKDREMKYGEYEIPPGSSMEEILALLATGGNVFHRVTIPEGMTTHFALERILAADLLTGEITTLPQEGALLPDTYTYQRGSTRGELVAQMQAEMTRFLDEAWAGRDPDSPLASKEELLILASIIEKETRPQEHGKVASVFINRINRGMKLQTDPTVIYGITEGKATLGRGLRRSELDRATPYNTYVIEGLPPGPICNPGRESILAAANPEQTPYLFFVADGTGGHAFAETLAEHNKNVAAWRRIERERQANE